MDREPAHLTQESSGSNAPYFQTSDGHPLFLIFSIHSL